MVKRGSNSTLLIVVLCFVLASASSAYAQSRLAFSAVASAAKAHPSPLVSPAEIVSTVSLGPALGNGQKPEMAAVDSKRRQLWVLNRSPQSISIIDLHSRKLVGFLPLTVTTAPRISGLDDSDVRAWLMYDAHSDRFVLSYNDAAWSGFIVSINARTRLISAQRKLSEGVFYRTAMDSHHGKVYFAILSRRYQGEWGIAAFDDKTLDVLGNFATGRPIEALAISARSGTLYTVETSRTNVGGVSGPFSGTRVFERNSVSGTIVRQSPDEYPYPDRLYVDDSRSTIYLVNGNHEEARGKGASEDLWQYRSTIPTTISVLNEASLTFRRWFRFDSPTPNRGDHYLHIGPGFLDSSRERLVTYSAGKLFLLPLTGSKRITNVSVDGTIYSAARLAAIDPQTGQSYLLMDNGVRILDARTMLSSQIITLGTTIQNLFVDRLSGDMVAYVDRGVHEMIHIDASGVRRMFKSYLLPNVRLLAADFDNRTISYVNNDGWGAEADLKVIDFSGRAASGGLHAEDGFFAVTAAKDRRHSFRLLSPAWPESGHASKRYTLDLMDGSMRRQSVPVTELSADSPASQFLYAPEANRLYVVHNTEIDTYNGSDLGLISKRGFDVIAISTGPYKSHASGELCVDDAGEFVYCADCEQHQIVKIRIADGSVAARGSLGFPPSLIRYDGPRGRILVVDSEGGRIVSVSKF